MSKLNTLKQLHNDANNHEKFDTADRKLGKLANDTEEYTNKYEDPNAEFNTLKDLSGMEAKNGIYPKDKLISKDKSYLENENTNDKQVSNDLELLQEQPTLDYYVKKDKPGLDGGTTPYYSVSEKDFRKVGKQLDKEDIKPDMSDLKPKFKPFSKSKIESSGTSKPLHHDNLNNHKGNENILKHQRNQGTQR